MKPPMMAFCQVLGTPEQDQLDLFSDFPIEEVAG
jgi:hypothetical protein